MRISMRPFLLGYKLSSDMPKFRTHSLLTHNYREQYSSEVQNFDQCGIRSGHFSVAVTIRHRPQTPWDTSLEYAATDLVYYSKLEYAAVHLVNYSTQHLVILHLEVEPAQSHWSGCGNQRYALSRTGNKAMHVAMADYTYYATCRYLGLRSWGLHHCDQHEQSFQMMSIFAVQ